MKTSTLLLASHTAISAIIAAAFVVAFQSAITIHLGMASLFAILAITATTWFTATRVQAGLALLESAVTDQERAESLRCGLHDFDQAATRIGLLAGRWETIAADTRKQSGELQTMLSLLNRRDEHSQPSSKQLRDLLAGLGNMLHSQLNQIERGAVEIESQTRMIADGAETQGNSVIKATTYVEQFSSTIETISNHTCLAETAIQRNEESAAAAVRLVGELINTMNNVRSESQTCEKKLRGLCDPSQQISSIVGTIGDIAARTDLLALNASIESIRAGEHGRGFAIVADEVRKLAEQASDATREIASLIDSMQVVTHESIRGIERQRQQVESTVDRAVATEHELRKIQGSAELDNRNLRQIANASTQQLQLTQEVVLAIEQISSIAKANRSSAETVNWTMKSMSQTTPQLSSTIERLRRCGDSSARETDDPPRVVTPAAPVSVLGLDSHLVSVV